MGLIIRVKISKLALLVKIKHNFIYPCHFQVINKNKKNNRN